MRLGELSDIVSQWDDNDFVFSSAFDSCHSYRGYYYEVAFAPSDSVSVAQVKAVVDSACNDTFEGWKGGEYTYDADTPCNLAFDGCTGDRDYMAFEDSVKEMQEEYNNHQLNKKIPLSSTKTKNKMEKKMARETKAQREAREEQERKEYLEMLDRQQRETYQQRLMEMLERAQNVNFVLTVANGKFLVQDSDDRSEGCFELSVTFDEDSQEGLVQLDWRVEMKEEAEREAQRKFQVKQGALAKLTKEEKELLGVCN